MSEGVKWWVWPARVMLAVTYPVWILPVLCFLAADATAAYMGWVPRARCSICKQEYEYGRRSCVHIGE